MATSYTGKIEKIAFIGNYLPRKCGIATFTTDLLHSIQDISSDCNCWAIAINDTSKGYNYPQEVRFEINQNKIQDYHLAAEFMNINRVDVVSLQHEYGIFGGKEGVYILSTLKNLNIPIVSTLHTVLDEPNKDQHFILREICDISSRLVVMSQRAEVMLETVYGISREKIVVIPHGIPDIPFIDPNFYKDQFGVEGRRVILTFGLLSPNKGIEYMIDAMPTIVNRYPDTVYIVLGVTHPNIKRVYGEEYRHNLQRKAQNNGVEKNIIFYNRFVDIEELIEFLGSADIYVTPYLSEKQIVSGTLAYAMGAGKAIVSTPYWYAEEMLSDGRGRLVPFENSEALAKEIIDLFDNDIERHAIRKRAYKYSRNMIWREVAKMYYNLFKELKLEQYRKPIITRGFDAAYNSLRALPEINLTHLKNLTDDTGIIQHARYVVPHRIHGYCTDDNARALIVTVLADRILPEDETLQSLKFKYLSFLDHAFNDETGRFRNFMSYDRKWLEDAGSEDAHGRALWALGVMVNHMGSESVTAMILNLFNRALPAVGQFKSLRGLSYSLLGISMYLNRFDGDSNAKRLRDSIAESIYRRYVENSNPSWRWFEDICTYANPRISQSMIFAGHQMDRKDIVQVGLDSLDWLIHVQKDERGYFVPIGNQGWFKKGDEKARFDQQPIEATSMIDALATAFAVTGESHWREEAFNVFEWFLGKNDMHSSLYDYTTGGCRDGLQADGVNLNQGAESTISWLLSLLRIYSLKAESNSIAVKNYGL